MVVVVVVVWLDGGRRMVVVVVVRMSVVCLLDGSCGVLRILDLILVIAIWMVKV